VPCTKISSQFEFGGQRAKTRKSEALISAIVLWGAVLCSARHWRGYASGKISACCLVSHY